LTWRPQTRKIFKIEGSFLSNDAIINESSQPKQSSSAQGYLTRLELLLRRAPGVLARFFCGEVAFIIVGNEPPDWTLSVQPEEISITPRKAQKPLARIAMTRGVLGWLMAGKLDVERAFKEKRLAVEGDYKVLERIVGCFEPPQSMVGLRARK
jgi:hypothetical protein